MSNSIVYLMGITIGFIDCLVGVIIIGEVLENSSLRSEADIWDFVLLVSAALLGVLGLHLWLYGLSPPSGRR